MRNFPFLSFARLKRDGCQKVRKCYIKRQDIEKEKKHGVFYETRILSGKR